MSLHTLPTPSEKQNSQTPDESCQEKVETDVHDVTYSVIIPHYDIPQLLSRCLQSIPIRKDIQIIVVDDCSPNWHSYYNSIPELAQVNVEHYSLPQRGGAGAARNEGLKYARGKWLLFADADDFYEHNAWTFLDKHKEDNADIVYYCHKDVLSDNILIERTRCYEFNDIMKSDKPIEEKEKFFRYRHNVPWAKMIRRDFVEKNNLKYEEIEYSNDIIFNIKAGCIAHQVKLVDEPIYVLTERIGSLTSGSCQTIEELLIRAKAHIRMQSLIEKYGYFEEAPAMWFMPTLFKRNRSAFYSALKDYKKNKLSLKRIITTMRPQIRPLDMLILLVLITLVKITSR